MYADEHEEAAAYEAHMAEMEYFQRPVSVFCELCDREATAPRATLVACGWIFPKGQQICGGHN